MLRIETELLSGVDVRKIITEIVEVCMLKILILK
jgi:hypothetical protein